MKTNLVHEFLNSKSDVSPFEASAQEKFEQDFQEWFEQRIKDYDFAIEYELSITSKNWWNGLAVQNLENMDDSWVGYVNKYLPNRKGGIYGLTDNEIIYIYKRVFNNLPQYKLTGVEISSKLNRYDIAEGLILQLPIDHDGRNTWLLNYGKGDEAIALRVKHDLQWIEETQSAETTK